MLHVAQFQSLFLRPAPSPCKTSRIVSCTEFCMKPSHSFFLLSRSFWSLNLHLDEIFKKLFFAGLGKFHVQSFTSGTSQNLLDRALRLWPPRLCGWSCDEILRRPTRSQTAERSREFEHRCGMGVGPQRKVYCYVFLEWHKKRHLENVAFSDSACNLSGWLARMGVAKGEASVKETCQHSDDSLLGASSLWQKHYTAMLNKVRLERHCSEAKRSIRSSEL